jgi:hypothetical protein
MSESHDRFIDQLEEFGEPKVRLMMQTGGFFSPNRNADLIWWLGQKDAARAEKDRLAHREQARNAKWANVRDTIAALAAIAAAIAAIVGAFIAYADWARHS